MIEHAEQLTSRRVVDRIRSLRRDLASHLHRFDIADFSHQLNTSTIRLIPREAASRAGPTASHQALLVVVAYLPKGETYTDLASGFAIGVSTVYRYIREGIDLLAALAPTLEEAMAVARGNDLGAARDHGILDAMDTAEVQALGDTGYQGAGPAVTVPQRRRRKDPATGKYRPLSAAQKDVNKAHAALRGPGKPSSWPAKGN